MDEKKTGGLFTLHEHHRIFHVLGMLIYIEVHWNRAKLQLFNLTFGVVVSLAISLFSQLIIFTFTVRRRSSILSSISIALCCFLAMHIVHTDINEDLPRFRNSSLCCSNRFCSSHASTSKRSSPSEKWKLSHTQTINFVKETDKIKVRKNVADIFMIFNQQIIILRP